MFGLAVHARVQGLVSEIGLGYGTRTSEAFDLKSGLF